MVQRVNKTTVADSVLNEIRRMILDGELDVGDKLPNQTEFAEQLGCSRVSLRQALMTLSRLGAIEQRPGSGTTLIAKAPVIMATEMDMPAVSDDEATQELFEARKYIDTSIVELAVERATEEELSEIGKVLEQMREPALKGNFAEYLYRDMLYHLLLAKAAHNRFIFHLFTTIRQVIRLSDRSVMEAYFSNPEQLAESFKGHERVLNAIMRRDRPAALRAVNEHLEVVRNIAKTKYQDAKAG